MKPGERLGAVGIATFGTGAALTAGIASACCVGPALAPVFVAVLGAGGLAAVSGLRPYTPWLLLASGVMLSFSFWRTYRRATCAVENPATTCSFSLRAARFVTWLAALLWLASAVYAVYGFLNE